MKFKSNLSSKYTYEDFNLSCNNQAKENLHAYKECHEDKVGQQVAQSPNLYKPNFNRSIFISSGKADVRGGSDFDGQNV